MKRLDPKVVIWPAHYVTDADEELPTLTGEDWNQMVETVEKLQEALLQLAKQVAKTNDSLLALAERVDR